MKLIAMALILATFSPSVALAQTYPRQLKVDGMDCLQQPGRNGIETWCRKGDGPPERIEADTGLPTEADEQRSIHSTVATGWTANPHASALRAASRDKTGSYFMGGVGLGLALGPVGWVIAGVGASNSAVIVPRGNPRWTLQQQTQYALSYTSEVRRGRTTSAVLGGVTGTAVLTTLVLLITSGSD